jgi:uncharacterized membrane protein
MADVRVAIELAALVIELMAVATIVIALLHGTIRFLFRMRQQIGNAYDLYKEQIGKGLLLGLEFLVAADIIRTVALEPTLRNVAILGLLVLIRTFLSWSIVVEIEGQWPWNRSGAESATPTASAREQQAPSPGRTEP